MALQTKVSIREGVKGRFKTNLDDLKRFLLTKRRVQGTLGSTDTSSPRCETHTHKMQINAGIFQAPASTEVADFTAVRDGPGPGCLAGMLEGLMVAVQHEDDGSEQLVHPLQAEEEAKRRTCEHERGEKKKLYLICGQCLFNSDARGF